MGGRPTLDLRPPRLRPQAPTETEQAPEEAEVEAGSDAGRHERETLPDPRTLQELVSARRAAPPRRAGRRLFGEWLIRRRLLSREQLLRALATGERHEWRVGDAVVVLGFVPRARVEAEARLFELFERGPGLRETRRMLLEQRARRLELEEQTRRVRSAACGGTPRGSRPSSA